MAINKKKTASYGACRCIQVGPVGDKLTETVDITLSPKEAGRLAQILLKARDDPHADGGIIINASRTRRYKDGAKRLTVVSRKRFALAAASTAARSS